MKLNKQLNLKKNKINKFINMMSSKIIIGALIIGVILIIRSIIKQYKKKKRKNLS